MLFCIPMRTDRTAAASTARQALKLLLAALVLGGAVNLVHPKRIPWVEDWANRVEARAVAGQVDLVQLSDMIRFLRDDSRLFVDARPAADYARGHLPGAVSIPYEDAVKQPALLQPLHQSVRPPVVYCSGPECEDSLLLALLLREEGGPDAAVFVGGMELWKSEMLAIEGVGP